LDELLLFDEFWEFEDSEGSVLLSILLELLESLLGGDGSVEPLEQDNINIPTDNTFAKNKRNLAFVIY